ncbi:HEPN domain-containing protein [Asticcacaulis sp.]|uniref:HEPN domain-containing protein n=1 Tax=Asticcacaulis sp. TaxID=1872648 RepID=UPI003F7B4D2A
MTQKTLDAVKAYSTAKGYMQSAFILATSEHRRGVKEIDSSIFLSYSMLLGFAVELYLKAWLIAQGVEAWGHSLEKLHTKALQHQLPDIASDLVAKLDHHEKMEFRYMPDEGSYKALNIKQTFYIIDQLDALVDWKCGASALHGKPLRAPLENPLWTIPDWAAEWRFITTEI